MRSLFITGGSGFIGRHFLRRLDAAKYGRIYCLSRDRAKLAWAAAGSGAVQIIQGDLGDSASYASALVGVDTVVHLAATTGKAMPQAYQATNEQGTAALVAASEQAGVQNFLFMSTIAVKYPDKSHYYYAQSKEAAETVVRTSRLHHVVARPTIVIGPDGEAWRSLSRLGRAPILLVFGSGQTRVQPIYVEDLVTCLLHILDTAPFQNEVVELGGPEVASFEQFLGYIALAYRGSVPVTVHLPLRLLTTPLAVLERLLSEVLPLSAGQLSVFANDSTAESVASQRNGAGMLDIRAMIRLAIREEGAHVDAHPGR